MKAKEIFNNLKPHFQTCLEGNKEPFLQVLKDHIAKDLDECQQKSKGRDHNGTLRLFKEYNTKWNVVISKLQENKITAHPNYFIRVLGSIVGWSQADQDNLLQIFEKPESPKVGL